MTAKRPAALIMSQTGLNAELYCFGRFPAVSCFAIRAHLQRLTRLQDTEGTTRDCSKLGSELEIAASALESVRCT